MTELVETLKSKVLASAIAAAFVISTPAHSNPQQKGYSPPVGLVPRSASEYYSTAPNAQILIPVNIWGEVREPGVHYVVPGSTVVQTLTVAGGPLPTASLPEVQLISTGGNLTFVDIIADGGSHKVKENETIFVERSFKQDVPLILTGISVAISMATLYFVTSKQN